MRKLTAAVITAGLFFGGMGAAAAASAWHDTGILTTGGADFKEGKYKWEDPGQMHGAFHIKGKLRDTGLDDDHNVYLQVKVHSYAWNRFNGTQKKNVWLDKIVYDGATRYTNTAEVRVCQNRGSLRPDNYSFTKRFKRP
ncbi:hypothetical protein C5L38_16040 [Streptomyces sp. WAC00288]|uniref:hypothetical protein n=1 Tax=unclassified Streptomyces TaxID=2593676 RepID=UPI0007893CEC|nr:MULTISPECIES: hypothetical protein [unclassified Streptomyces]AVH99660.1 hypothetical protein C5L38_16040 [Streptomyces sp. WAC00288]KYG56978.1 hypothetical protein AWI43_11765 [Streptomyces sp. WAC04657]